ncbi:PIG-L family deacetylase [Microbacterium neungamense]|uniref:PIG-L family deacetylase n=1 Tax=Microbacterium neungamense TaxID=2810535 RepID=UPI00217E758F|nr:PIG-L family deacetylase [Microbacterium neungamense]UWF77267.1 PIG-L family deacetylase [Microbacterium neungamense]
MGGSKARRWLPLAALALVMAVVAGCGVPAADPAETVKPPETTPTPIATPTPTPAPVVPVARNGLTAERIAQLQASCPQQLPAEVAGRLPFDLSQARADAVDFFASTGQCGDVPAVLNTPDAAAAEFRSPVQYLTPACPAGTIVSFWAHFDDDLLFGSPTLPEALDAGQCLRSFFFTNGDAGKGRDYAVGREEGIRLAYDAMRGASTPWTDRTVTLRSGLTVLLTQPADDPRITLIMLRLPDGNLTGDGFPVTGSQSLAKLWLGGIDWMTTFDTAVQVTLDELKATVAELSAGFAATRVLAHMPGFAAGATGDHPDHRVVGRIVASQAESGAIDPAVVSYAQGYPVAQRPANLTDAQLDRKLRIFAAYAGHDPVIPCSQGRDCLAVRKFGDWLRRQYLVSHQELMATG